MDLKIDRREWDTFVRKPKDLKIGTLIPLVIRDLGVGRTKYRIRHVMGVIHESGGPGDVLLVRTVVGVLLDREYTVEIKGELPQEIPGSPYKDFYVALNGAAL